MNILNKKADVIFFVTKKGDDILFGLNIFTIQCPCCGNIMNVTELGIGIASVSLVLSSKGHEKDVEAE